MKKLFIRIIYLFWWCTEVKTTENNDDNQQEYEYDDDGAEGDDYVDEDEEGDEDDEEDEDVKMFESYATLYGQNEGDLQWNHLGKGKLTVIYDSSFFGARIVCEDSEKQSPISDTVISMDTTMEVCNPNYKNVYRKRFLFIF